MYNVHFFRIMYTAFHYDFMKTRSYLHFLCWPASWPLAFLCERVPQTMSLLVWRWGYKCQTSFMKPAITKLAKNTILLYQNCFSEIYARLITKGNKLGKLHFYFIFRMYGMAAAIAINLYIFTPKENGKSTTLLSIWACGKFMPTDSGIVE